MTNLDRDEPSVWLCGAKHDAYSIFFSDKDPVRGESQRELAESCGFPILPASAPGHVPLACRLELFDEMIATLRSPELGGPVASQVLGNTRSNFAAFEPSRHVNKAGSSFSSSGSSTEVKNLPSASSTSFSATFIRVRARSCTCWTTKRAAS